MFVLTEEIKTQIATFQSWSKSLKPSHGIKPINPWPDLIKQMVNSISDITIGWGSHDVICIDFIEGDYIGDFFDHLLERYEVGAMDAQDIIDALKPFKTVKQLY